MTGDSNTFQCKLCSWVKIPPLSRTTADLLSVCSRPSVAQSTDFSLPFSRFTTNPLNPSSKNGKWIRGGDQILCVITFFVITICFALRPAVRQVKILARRRLRPSPDRLVLVFRYVFSLLLFRMTFIIWSFSCLLVPRGSYSPSLEEPYHLTWSRLCHRCRLQRCHSWVSHRRSMYRV